MDYKDHSVQGYLERQSTEELCSILNYCLDVNRFIEEKKM